MDSLHRSGSADDEDRDDGQRPVWAIETDDEPSEPLPPVLADERRMQIRAYNYWARQLGPSPLPLVAPLLNGELPPFADHAVLLRLDGDRDDPEILFMGAALAATCGEGRSIARLGDAPAGSLLARLAAHLPRLRTSQAPTSFDAEFVDGRGSTILTRGILLPYSQAGTRLDHALCAINWKELADAATTAALRTEIGRLFEQPAPVPLAPSARGLPDDDLPEKHTLGVWGKGLTDVSDSTPLGEPIQARLRALPPRTIDGEGSEFAVVVIRRAGGSITVLGEVADDAALLERAVRRLMT